MLLIITACVLEWERLSVESAGSTGSFYTVALLLLVRNVTGSGKTV